MECGSEEETLLSSGFKFRGNGRTKDVYEDCSDTVNPVPPGQEGPGPFVLQTRLPRFGGNNRLRGHRRREEEETPGSRYYSEVV